MRPGVNPYACYDTLFVISRTQQVMGNAMAGEVHLLAYLACLLSMYRGRAASDWGYWFIRSPYGAPYSSDIDRAVESMQANGWIGGVDRHLTLSSAGGLMLETLSQLGQNGPRKGPLDAACASILSVPMGIVRTAVSMEPELRNAEALSLDRTLLDEPEIPVPLHDQFEALRRALGIRVADLMVPAVVWLSYLSRVAQEEMGMQEPLTP